MAHSKFPVSHAKREWGKPPREGLGALSVGELNSPRVAPLHRFYFPHPPHPTPHTLYSFYPCCHPLSRLPTQPLPIIDRIKTVKLDIL